MKCHSSTNGLQPNNSGTTIRNVRQGNAPNARSISIGVHRLAIGSNSRSTKPVNQPISQSSRQSRAGTAQRKRGAEELDDAHSNSEATSRATVKRSRSAGTFETDDVSVKQRLYKLGEDYLGDRAKKNDVVYCQEKWNSEHYQLVLQAWLDNKQDKTQLKDFTAALRSLVARRFPIQAVDAALPAHDAEMNNHSGDQSSSVSH
jgi:hypothetical protein